MNTQLIKVIAGENEQVTVRLPGVEWPVEVGLDFYGEKSPRFQVLCYDSDGDEARAAVRFDANGKIQEVMVGPNIKVTTDSLLSSWMLERDGMY